MDEQTLNRKDYFVVAVIGFFIGLLVLPVLNNLKISALNVTFVNSLLIVIGCAVFALLALWLAFWVNKLIPFALQFAKFSAIGALNTLLDFGVLNILIFISSMAAGYWYSVFKGISFVVASTNSYFWNRYWTFGMQKDASAKEFTQFMVVSIIGLVLNTGTASFFVNFINHPASISPERWANIGALLATAASFIWNFLGYKFIVFKK